MPEAPPYPQSHQLLAGKRVLVTAAAGAGIGFATAKRCAEEGGIVIVSDQHEQRLKEAAEQLKVASQNAMRNEDVAEQGWLLLLSSDLAIERKDYPLALRDAESVGGGMGDGAGVSVAARVGLLRRGERHAAGG